MSGRRRCGRHEGGDCRANYRRTMWYKAGGKGGVVGARRWKYTISVFSSSSVIVPFRNTTTRRPFRLSVVGPPYPKSSFRPRQVRNRDRPGVMEGNISGSFDLSCSLRQHIIHSLSPRRHGRGCGTGWLDRDFLSHHGLASGQPKNVYVRRRSGGLSAPTPQIRTHPQISPRGFRLHSALEDLRPRPFIPPS